jgi:hypothetical protein
VNIEVIKMGCFDKSLSVLRPRQRSRHVAAMVAALRKRYAPAPALLAGGPAQRRNRLPTKPSPPPIALHAHVDKLPMSASSRSAAPSAALACLRFEQRESCAISVAPRFPALPASVWAARVKACRSPPSSAACISSSRAERRG